MYANTTGVQADNFVLGTRANCFAGFGIRPLPNTAVVDVTAGPWRPYQEEYVAQAFPRFMMSGQMYEVPEGPNFPPLCYFLSMPVQILDPYAHIGFLQSPSGNENPITADLWVIQIPDDLV